MNSYKDDIDRIFTKAKNNIQNAYEPVRKLSRNERKRQHVERMHKDVSDIINKMFDISKYTDEYLIMVIRILQLAYDGYYKDGIPEISDANSLLDNPPIVIISWIAWYITYDQLSFSTLIGIYECQCREKYSNV